MIIINLVLGIILLLILIIIMYYLISRIDNYCDKRIEKIYEELIKCKKSYLYLYNLYFDTINELILNYRYDNENIMFECLVKINLLLELIKDDPLDLRERVLLKRIVIDTESEMVKNELCF